MRGRALAVDVEFFFQERVDGGIEIEWKSGRTRGAEFVVDIETARALHKESYLRTGKPPFIAAVVPIRLSIRLVVIAHVVSIPYPPELEKMPRGAVYFFGCAGVKQIHG